MWSGNSRVWGWLHTAAILGGLGLAVAGVAPAQAETSVKRLERKLDKMGKRTAHGVRLVGQAMLDGVCDMGSGLLSSLDEEEDGDGLLSIAFILTGRSSVHHTPRSAPASSTSHAAHAEPAHKAHPSNH
jgi:hypothetical protein